MRRGRVAFVVWTLLLDALISHARGWRSSFSPVASLVCCAYFSLQRDGRLAARLMLENAPKHSCTDPIALQADMHEIVSAIPLEHLGRVDLGRLLSEVMNCVRRHHVKLESDFASLVISLAIIEGIGRQLDPEISLFHEAVPVMLKNRETRTILLETAGVRACAKLGLVLAKEELHALTHKGEE
jgi:predicted unusual protein kinase regulating ubiquinone biosynthesis (AarF/ABC1/UbiB family)